MPNFEEPELNKLPDDLNEKENEGEDELFEKEDREELDEEKDDELPTYEKDTEDDF